MSNSIVCIINFLREYITHNQQWAMTQTISGWIFDLSKPVYLEHPNYKFWELTLNGKNVTFRVGKIRDGEQTNVELVTKDYSSMALSKNTAINKIEDKLTKGYSPKDAKIAEQPKKGNAEPIKKEIKNNHKKVFSGQYYAKGDQAVRLQVSNNKVKTTRIDKGKEKFEIRAYKSYQQAVQYCLQEETWLLGEGYKADNSKFIYSFIDDQPIDEDDKSKKASQKTRKKQDAPSSSNFLSITKMTDDAISHRSRNVSTAKSDRSYVDDGDDNSYAPSALGPSVSGCIKVLLAETWDNEIDPTGYIMSQKLDGVRCFWTGTTMYSRNGNRFFFPKFFTKGWPKSQMDGELFIDRGKFSQTLSAVKKNVPIDQQWENVRYLVFDCPGLKLPFKKRLQMMQKVIKEIDSPYIKCHGHRQCKGYEDLFHQLDEVNKIQGEGLMLRNPDSMYENRRSKTLLKVKTFHDDEAEVIGYKAGTGRCHGMVGALRVRNTHGVQFEVGSGMTDEIRRHPPKIGSKITYKYQQFNKDSGKPRFPTYMRKFEKI